MRVLVVEDARDLAKAIVDGLQQNGFDAEQCADGETALTLAIEQAYAGMILDCMLPKRDGLEICRELRARGSELPILMLTARDTIEDRVAGLDAGADDYLVKPFAFPELVARTRALTRRSAGFRTRVLRAGDVAVDLNTGRVTRGNEEISLTAKEQSLLVALMRQPGRLLTHNDLVDQAWKMESIPSPQLVRTHIKNLRRKLTPEGEAGIIETVHGVGYRIVV